MRPGARFAEALTPCGGRRRLVDVLRPALLLACDAAQTSVPSEAYGVCRLPFLGSPSVKLVVAFCIGSPADKACLAAVAAWLRKVRHQTGVLRRPPPARLRSP